ncbi:MAG TPA: hypothetical protein VMB21_20970 [Candidatus Limnocylindria bacterium]|nr:hypothetical protein [Candidatus Limnocylindria bacterium]
MSVCCGLLQLLPAGAAGATQYGVTNDLWDVSQGTVVTAFSDDATQYYGTATAVPYAENIFGARHTGFPREDGSFVFADGKPAGFVHFVEWRTAQPVSIRSFKVYAADDGAQYNHQREFGTFTLKTKSPGSTNFDTVLYTYTAATPYVYADAPNYALIDASVVADNVQEFRAEFTDKGGGPFSAPRVMEMDALGVSTPPIGSRDDLWDVSRGTVVTTNSPEANYFDGRPYHAENIFGANVPGFPLEPGDFIFQDGQTNGYVHFVEWHTAAPVTVRSFKLYAAGDGPIYNNQREFASFVLKAKSPGSAVYDQVLYTYTPSHPYLFYNFDELLLLQANLAAVTAQDFRAEFVNRSTNFYSGPRIIELDGFGDALPLELRARQVVELSWASEPGKHYQLQSKSQGDTDWVNVGDPVTATAFSTSSYQPISDSGNHIYRVVDVTTP